ncbi:MAG: hypothetical protein NTX50_12310 [Candidatus Sumerlaeota bacterium]|nr:hypothetical protein [Candidatus Sumerlaeota bacterium]
MKEKKENRKILLLTGKHLTIGRDSFERRPDIDLTLRLIPARDPQADPEGEINRLISREQARIEPVEDHFVIHNIGSQRFEIAGLELPDIFAPLDASEESDTGQSSDGAQDGGQAASFLSDRIQMIPHDEDRKHQPITLRIDQSARLPYFCEIRFAKGALRLRVQTYYSSRYGLQALGLRRMNNFEKLEYIWVRRSCYIGGSEGCPIRVESGRLPDKAAVLEWRDGYFALRAGIDKLPVKLDGVPLEKRQVAAIERPCLLQIGDYSWQIDKAQKSDFTDI